MTPESLFAGNGYAALSRKAGASLHDGETEVIKEWLKHIIDDLGLVSLQAFPTQELTVGFPELIAALAQTLREPETDLAANPVVMQLAALLATLRKEDSDVARMVDDLQLLKRLMVFAMSRRMRDADRSVLAVSQRLDDSFNQIVKAGLDAYIQQHSLELQHQANTDGLTGLYNVRYFRQQLHRNLEMFKRYRIPFSLVMIDLDKLKQLNDACGHEYGDRALKNLAAILHEEKRETDIAVRYGGDEFFVVLPGTNTTEAERLARRISIRTTELNMHSGGMEMTGVSIGVVSCPSDGTDVGTLRARADRALYLSKSIGGGTVARYRKFSLEPQIVF